MIEKYSIPFVVIMAMLMPIGIFFSFYDKDPLWLILSAAGLIIFLTFGSKIR